MSTARAGSTTWEALALNGGRPVRPAPLPWGLVVTDVLRRRILEAVDTGILSEWYNGPQARRFEDAFAAFHGEGVHAVAVNSGTSALHLALEVAGVGSGDEVILPALCYVAAAVAVVQLGATPVICDVEQRSLTLDPERARELIGPQTRAILPVHFWGYPADLPALRRLCDEHGLALVEDAAQAPGCRVGDALTGSFGDTAAFSFANRKHVTCGEGGMVLCRSADVAARVRALANCGKGIGWDEYESHGYSYRMVEVSAVAGLYGLARIGEEIAARRAAATKYRRMLAGSTLEPVPDPPWGEAVYFKLPIMLPGDRAGDRDLVVRAIAAENVSCRVPHRPLYAIEWLAQHVEQAGRPSGPEECPVTARLYPRLFEVETGPNLPPDEASRSATAVDKVWRAIREARGG